MNQRSAKVMKFAIDMVFTLVGCIIFAVGIYVFIQPNQIAPGGVSGISIMLHYLTGLPVGVLSLLMNIPLLLLAWKFLGWKFTGQTLMSVATLSFMLDYVAVLLPQYEGDPLLAALFGGALIGTGLAVVFMRGFTTGGTDIISRLLQLKYPYLQLGKILMVIDLIVILTSAYVFGRIETALYGMVAVFTSSRMVDSLLYGMDTGKLVYIMSCRAVELSERIIEGLGRGCTILKSTGAYTKQDSNVLMVAVRRPQYYILKKMVREMDPKAFIIVTDATEVLGEGFKRIE